MRRRSASPDADTMSYWPPPPLAMSETISLDVPANFALTLQPVWVSNGFTHDGSVYPSQAMRLSDPSPFPMLVCGAWSAVGTLRPDVPLSPVPVVLPVDELFELL